MFIENRFLGKAMPNLRGRTDFDGQMINLGYLRGTPSGYADMFCPTTQGNRCAVTLGFVVKPRWGRGPLPVNERSGNKRFRLPV